MRFGSGEFGRSRGVRMAGQGTACDAGPAGACEIRHRRCPVSIFTPARRLSVSVSVSVNRKSEAEKTQIPSSTAVTVASEDVGAGLGRRLRASPELDPPKGSLGVSRLDGKEDEIRHFLNLGVPKSAIAKITGVSRPTLYNFISTRGLKPYQRVFLHESGWYPE